MHEEETQFLGLLSLVLLFVFQASDRHAYDWERCLEQCRLLLSQAEEIFSSVSSSAVCHEIEAVDAGRSFLTSK